MSVKKCVFFSIVLFVFSFVSGCTLSPKLDKNPPFINAPSFASNLSEVDIEKLHSLLEKQMKEDPRLNMLWWTRYNQARLWIEEDPQLSCEYFRELSNEEKFPLKDLAALRSSILCGQSSTGSSSLQIQQAKEKSWLKELAMEASLAQAKAEGDLQAEMENYVYRSKISVVMPEKIELMQKAIEIALQLGDEKIVAKHTERLHMLSPQTNPQPQRKDWMKLAYNLRRERKFNEARDYYQKVIAHRRSSEREIYKALYGIRTSYKLERKTGEYLEATKKIAMYTYRLFQKNKRYKRSARSYAAFYHDTALIYIRALWTDGQIKKAHDMLVALEKDLGSLKSAEKILWLRGRMADEKKNFKTASDLYQRSLKACGSRCNKNNYEEIVWNLGWALKKQKRLQEAADSFALLEKKSSDNDAAKYLFWLAKTMDQSGRSLEARSKYAELIQNDPYGYYGLLAHRELGVPLDSIAGKKQTSAVTTTEDHAQRFGNEIDTRYAEWLIAVGEEEVATHFLDHVASHLRQKEVKDHKRWSDLFMLYARNNSFVQLFRQIGKLPSELKSDLLAQHPQMIFPQPYSDAVNRSAKRFGLLPELIYSIMRQESAFNRMARSPADAFGLMQLIPSVAAQTAEKVDVPFSGHRDLFNPEVNIELGSAHLKKLWDKYQGQFVILAASYNASEKAIRGWVQHRFEGDPIQFIEDIPYKETQAYIKLVLRNLIFYKVLNAQGEPVDFPEWCLENIQDVNI